MSFVTVTKSNTDSSLVRLHPSRSFSSSSAGTTGSIRVIAQSSPSFKEVNEFSPFVDSPSSAVTIEDYRSDAFSTRAAVTPVVATGSISGSWTGVVSDPIPSGLTLTFHDHQGNVYAATTDNTVTRDNSFGTVIGVGGGMTGATDLVEAIKISINEARLYGVTQTSKGSAGASGALLQVEEPTENASGYYLFVTQSDHGYSGNSIITGSLVDLAGLTTPRLRIQGFGGGAGDNLTSVFDGYMKKVNSSSQAARQSKYVEVLRFTPTNTFTSDTVRKSIYRKVLLPQYQTENPDIGFNFTNYQCFNFVSSSAFPSASCLMYPEPLDQYAVMSGFTFSFNINANRDAGNNHRAYPPGNGVAWDYPAGCVLFRSSSYAVSIITGSHKTKSGNPKAFRVLLQLTGAVDTDPSTVSLSALPDNTFVSSDNVLKKNHWHNVAISWGKDHNSGTGSFYIDGVKDEGADFTLGTADINLNSTGSHQALMVGARYSGKNDGSAPTYSGFFNANVSSEGVWAGGPTDSQYEPSGSQVVNRLNAEVNDIRVHSNVISADEVMTGSREGLVELPRGLVFYAPGFFVKESPNRKSYLTPFQQETTGTQEPYNVKLNFGVNGRDINVQNFVRDFAQKENPRLWYLTSSAITVSTETYDANAFIYEMGSNRDMHRARNMFVLPCDNGKFGPGWKLLASGTVELTPKSDSPMSMFVTDQGDLNYSVVSLNNMISTSSILEGLVQINSDGTDNTSNTGLLSQINGASPESAAVDPGSGYTILQRTRDNSSNVVVFFDSSNLFYGNAIEKHSVVLSSTELSGTGGALSMKLKDNGAGGMYRADAGSKHASFSRVGDLLYQEGLIGIHHPCIPFFGKNNFNISFKGDQNVHVFEVNVPALAGMLNSSSNPGFVAGSKDDYASSYEGYAVGISSILFHDENFNVIARTNLAQPILKTEFDKYMFRVKFDF